jgi:hypothetical protein
MNDTIHHDGRGGFETESFRAKSLLILKSRGHHSDYLTQLILQEAMKPIHFLDTPEGRKWENIVACRIAQKENKKGGHSLDEKV